MTIPWSSVPPQWRAKACANNGVVLLESSLPSEADQRSFLFETPIQILTAHSGDDLPALFGALEHALDAGHWAAGYFTYEAGAHFLGLPQKSSVGPLATIGVYDKPLIFNNHDPDDSVPAAAPSPLSIAPMPRTSVPEYTEAIKQIHQWITAGDTYQLNYTMSLETPCPHSALEVYEALRTQQRSSYAAVVNLEHDRTVLSLSPELFFRVDASGAITTRPMKGTAPRSLDPADDARLCAALQNDEKNRAEHVMIVDLLRNDLNRICRTGTVHADDLFRIEQYETVHQMTSRVSGLLPRNTSWYDVFRALFPSGSITGAPKRHTAELIAELEPMPRGVYTGAIGYFAPDRTACFNVAIRTGVLQHSATKQDSSDPISPPHHQPVLTFGVGGGIVADSTADAEYKEALLKSAFMWRSAVPLYLIETMRANDGAIPLLERHLRRLEGSATALAFACDPDAIRLRVNNLAAQSGGQRRIRLKLDRSGSFELADSEAPYWPSALRLTVSLLPTRAGSPHLSHKTTFRPEYNDAYTRATNAGFDDALFLNTAGDVTETCIANVLVCLDGCWYTPPLSCGVLHGVLLQHLLETGQIHERALTLAHFQGSQAVAVCNALRGVAPVAELSFDDGKSMHWSALHTPLPRTPW